MVSFMFTGKIKLSLNKKDKSLYAGYTRKQEHDFKILREKIRSNGNIPSIKYH
jgi:hypothetical protein